MSRRQRRPAAPRTRTLTPLQQHCPACGRIAPVSYHEWRTVATLEGLWRPRLVVRRCQEATCALDRAVWAAYGWDDPDPATVPEEEILERLLALNQERAGAGA